MPSSPLSPPVPGDGAEALPVWCATRECESPASSDGPAIRDVVADVAGRCQSEAGRAEAMPISSRVARVAASRTSQVSPAPGTPIVRRRGSVQEIEMGLRTECMSALAKKRLQARRGSTSEWKTQCPAGRRCQTNHSVELHGRNAPSVQLIPALHALENASYHASSCASCPFSWSWCSGWNRCQSAPARPLSRGRPRR